MIEIGDAVARVKLGDIVCLPFNISCGFCKNCERGLTGFCLTLNSGTAGAAYGYAGMGRSVYLHYEVTSLLARFVDDVEILFDDATTSIHFRSVARTGYYDFCVNRRRMEEVRSRLDDQG